ncbi:MAG: class I SAM-dependent methyltransferase [Candidatus Hydrogenedentes bacterium]|nr:class I SAM-dependent methyltransferase [Candidatus Hydrogenedentota bacterium]
MPPLHDSQWYRKIWTLDIEDLSWVEDTLGEVDFIAEALGLTGSERVLDLACGFGRHALELARRGHAVVGVDITPAYIDEARRRAAKEGLAAEFICADVRDVALDAEFDTVLSLADGAIGYLEDEQENLKVFDRIASALKPGGRHLMAVCNGAYARKHFPKRHWDMGARALSLADFAWDEQTARMTYTGYSFRLGEVLAAPAGSGPPSWIRLYTIEELRAILAARGLVVQQAYGGYDTGLPASEDTFMLVVCSEKGGSTSSAAAGRAPGAE